MVLAMEEFIKDVSSSKFTVLDVLERFTKLSASEMDEIDIRSVVAIMHEVAIFLQIQEESMEGLLGEIDKLRTTIKSIQGDIRSGYGKP